MNKKIWSTAIAGMLFASTGASALACTGVIVGKDLTTDGSTIVGRTEDLTTAKNKVFHVYPAKVNPVNYVFKDPNGFKIKLPRKAMKYSAITDAETSEGIYDEVGFNEKGVGISATVSASANKEAQAADPYVATGLTEASLPTVVMPYVSTAREAVQRIASIVEKSGAGEGNIIFITDKKDVWYMEILTGHQYVAIKAPSDSYAIIPNTYMSGYVNLSDKANVIASKDLISLPTKKGFLKEHNGKFHIAKTYGPELADYDRARVWGGQHFFSPSQNIAYDTDTFSLFQKPDKKISVKDVMNLQRYRYEDTERNANLPENAKVRPIGTQTSMEAHILQLKSNYPAELGGLMWMAMANPEHSVYLPTFGNINDTYSAYKVADTSYNPASFYWTMRNVNTISALDRLNYGKPVRAYWSRYEDKLIAAQKASDSKMISTLKAKGPKQASKLATDLGKQIANDAFKKATRMNKELTTQFIKDDSRAEKRPFEFSLNPAPVKK